MNIVILAAGQGKRMRSDLPKVLHCVAGQPLLSHVLHSARSLRPNRLIIVYGHGGDVVRDAIGGDDIRWVRQEEQLGTGHAVQQACSQLIDDVPTLVLAGDVPLTLPSTLQRLAAAAQNDVLGLLAVEMPDPTGYGRLLREAGEVVGIVEQKDATDEQRKIAEVYAGILVAPTPALKRWLARLSNSNAQGEYYLTDIVAQAVSEKMPVRAVHPDHIYETAGVNSKRQLSELERIWQRNQAEGLMEAGVTVIDPARIDMRGTLECGRDVYIDVGCVFEGRVALGDRVRLGPYCVVRNATLAHGVVVEPFTVIDGAQIGEESRIGPFARLRPGASLAAEVHIGNFVEVKNSDFGPGSKANHLAYVGDASIGSRVNIGAGTITCNYDGANKHRTVIEDDVHIGSDTQLVAPVTVGRGSTVAAGTTVWKDVPPNVLALNGKTQTSRDGWQRPHKASKPKA